MSYLYRVVEVWAKNRSNPQESHEKKDIGCQWTTISNARNEMKELLAKNPNMSYGLETKKA
jgi:hypothetical protein